MEGSEAPIGELISKKIRGIEQKIFASVADHYRIKPFEGEDAGQVASDFVDVNGARFETQEGERGRVPYHTDGHAINFDRLREVGSFNVVSYEGKPILSMVDRTGHVLIGRSTDAHIARLMTHGYRRNTELSVPFARGEMPRDAHVRTHYKGQRFGLM